MTSDSADDSHAIILFDGVCNFCDASVNFVIRRDKRGYFRFAPLQEPKGAEIARRTASTPSAWIRSCSSRTAARTASPAALCASPGASAASIAGVRAHRRPAVHPRLLLRLVRPPPLPLVRQEGCVHGADAGGARRFLTEEFRAEARVETPRQASYGASARRSDL